MADNKEYMRNAFANAYQRKWEAKGGSLTEFVEKVRKNAEERGIDCKLTRFDVSKMKNGRRNVPLKYLEDICEVLQVDMDEFFPSSDEDKYRYSAEYQDEASEWNDRVAKDCFGLNLSLIYGLKQLIDFDSEFPAFAPLEWNPADPVEGFPFGLEYKRGEFEEASETSQGTGLFQIVHEGKVINLNPVDMKYLKAIQNYIVRKVREQFAHHKQELIDSMNEASDSCKEYLQKEKKIIIGQDPLSPDQLQKVDKWGLYSEAERNRYKIPDPPDNVPYTSAFTQEEKEIHIGRDPLPPDELREFFDKKKGEHDNGKAR